MSVASLVVGVAGATTDTPALLIAGVAGLVGGAISMALGEYVSVSSQRDSERALIEKETRELREMPDEELDELTGLYRRADSAMRRPDRSRSSSPRTMRSPRTSRSSCTSTRTTW